jgi:hypothetical protein
MATVRYGQARRVVVREFIQSPDLRSLVRRPSGKGLSAPSTCVRSDRGGPVGSRAPSGLLGEVRLNRCHERRDALTGSADLRGGEGRAITIGCAGDGPRCACVIGGRLLWWPPYHRPKILVGLGLLVIPKDALDGRAESGFRLLSVGSGALVGDGRRGAQKIVEILRAQLRELRKMSDPAATMLVCRRVRLLPRGDPCMRVWPRCGWMCAPRPDRIGLISCRI